LSKGKQFIYQDHRTENWLLVTNQQLLIKLSTSHSFVDRDINTMFKTR